MGMAVVLVLLLVLSSVVLVLVLLLGSPLSKRAIPPHSFG
jgi:hypothetical protein